MVRGECPSLPAPASVLAESWLAFAFSSIYPQHGLNASVLTLCIWSWGQSLSMAGKTQQNLTPNSRLTLHQAPHTIQHSWDTSMLTLTHPFHSLRSEWLLPTTTPILWRPTSDASATACLFTHSNPAWEVVVPWTLHSKPIARTFYHSTYKVI